MLGTDAKLLDAVSSAVQPAGGTVTFAASQADLARILLKQTPDMVLLDLKSAGTECLNWLYEVQQNPPAKPIFTITLASGNLDPGDILRAFELGANQCIEVPPRTHEFSAPNCWRSGNSNSAVTN